MKVAHSGDKSGASSPSRPKSPPKKYVLGTVINCKGRELIEEITIFVKQLRLESVEKHFPVIFFHFYGRNSMQLLLFSCY